MLDDILQGFLQDAVETEGDFRGRAFGMFSKWTSIADPADWTTPRRTLPPPFQSQEFESRGVKAVRQRLNVGHEIRNLLADRPDLPLDRPPKPEDFASGGRGARSANASRWLMSS